MATITSSDHLFAQVRELDASHPRPPAALGSTGCIPAAVMDAFFECDLFRILLPPELGGGGVDLLTGMLLVEQVAAIDGSMGWIFEIGIGSLVRLGFLPMVEARQLANDRRAGAHQSRPASGVS